MGGRCGCARAGKPELREGAFGQEVTGERSGRAFKRAGHGRAGVCGMDAASSRPALCDSLRGFASSRETSCLLNAAAERCYGIVQGDYTPHPRPLSPSRGEGCQVFKGLCSGWKARAARLSCGLLTWGFSEPAGSPATSRPASLPKSAQTHCGHSDGWLC